MSDQEINEIFSQVHNDSAIQLDLAEAADAAAELTLEQKVDYLFTQAKIIETLLEQTAPQVTALLAQAGPMLESLAPLLGQASSPMGRIFGSLIR